MRAYRSCGLAESAVAALGVRARVRAARTLLLEGSGTAYNLGQNRTPEAELPAFEVSRFRRAIDLTAGRLRSEQTRTPRFPGPAPGAQQIVVGLDGDVAYNVPATGAPTRAGEAAVRERRRELSAYPLPLLRAAPPPAPPAVNVAVEEIAPGVWYLTGGSHHSVVLEFADHLMLVEAPLNEARTLAIIARARELRPGKPVRTLVNTHHHFDRAGGIRTAIAEGLTIITHAANVPFFREVAGRPRTLSPDALARAPHEPAFEPVSGPRTFRDRTRRAEVYPVEGSAHAETLLMLYLPAERLLIQADLFSPPPPGATAARAPFAADLLANIERRRLRVERIVPIHGRVVPFADLVAAARAAAS